MSVEAWPCHCHLRKEPVSLNDEDQLLLLKPYRLWRIVASNSSIYGSKEGKKANDDKF